MKKNETKEFEKLKMYKEIFANNDSVHIWKKLDNGCYIGTFGYSEENVLILQNLLQSFAEQYGEEIDYNAAKTELKLYDERGKLFIYFDEYMKPISMNGCLYNEDNVSVEFISEDKKSINCLYFYGLSTLPEHRGKGACSHLVDFAIEYAYYNQLDYVYARTDLIGSNSEKIMARAGLDICTYDQKIIAEWVDVTDEYGDFRLHMWVPFSKGIYIMPKQNAYFADIEQRKIQNLQQGKTYTLKK